MARRTVTAYYSDLTGAAIDENESGTRFSLDGVDYKIDLTRSEQATLRDALTPFTSAARKLASPSQAGRLSGRKASSEPTSRALRAWAEANGFDVLSRGRVPEIVREAYKAAHPSE
jgi:hypothetical protein